MAAVDIPESQATVTVKIVDNGSRITGPMSFFMEPPLLDDLQSRQKIFAPAFVFLVEHEDERAGKTRRVVFDLGIRKNPAEYPPAVLAYHEAFEMVPGDKEVFDVLRSGGVDLDTVEAVIWSHHHMDHTGNPSGFPPATDLVVGPGFRETLLPAYPEREDAMIGQRDLRGRALRQLDFGEDSGGLLIGGYRAIDYFGDGSFYLLEAPGHSIDHIMGLARTGASPSRFILMGADIGTHAAQWRPSPHVPLPAELAPSPLGPASALNVRFDVCPGHLFADHVHPSSSSSTTSSSGSGETKNSPFARIRPGHPHDVVRAQRSLDMMMPFDADESIFVVAAHDFTLLPVVECFPEVANGWFEKGWKDKGRWAFLEGFAGIVEGKASLR
ncbi:hypothetical protein N3K66_006126 [Trichothecium roseum]|uniref:Uncharacterized protein n=1 Tax=Trichothecium roseum TaxID=47278 RepID=A0ACC0V0J0_9HYPO|nr:hypothetical protein N3K66_006126 [Trichothecium roseum]